MNVVEKVIFQIPERFGEIHINLLRIYQTPGFIPERIQLPGTVVPDIHDGRRCVDTFPVFEDRNKQFADSKTAACQPGLFPGGYRVKNHQRFAVIIMFIGQGNQVGFDFSGVFVVKTENGFIARVGDLFNIFRNLNLRYEVSLIIGNGRQFIDTAKGRAVFGSDEVGADAPGSDLRPPGCEGCQSDIRPGRWKPR